MKEFDFSKIDHLKPWALFLDIDGTICEFAATASAVVFPKTLFPVLQRLHGELGGALAIITGRSIESADRLFEGSGLDLPIAGLHGGEFRFTDGCERIDAPMASDEWREQARAVAARLPGVVYEEKRFGFGLHYRFAPTQGAAVWSAVEALVDGHPDFHMLPAAMAVEVRPNGIDKGQAIQRFMEHEPFKSRYPIFFGDDFTDEDGFHGVHMLRGTAVLVGQRNPSIAEYHVKDPETLRAMLTSLHVNLAANAA